MGVQETSKCEAQVFVEEFNARLSSGESSLREERAESSALFLKQRLRALRDANTRLKADNATLRAELADVRAHEAELTQHLDTSWYWKLTRFLKRVRSGLARRVVRVKSMRVTIESKE